MAAGELPSPDDLRNVLEYDPLTGELKWRPRPSNKSGWDAKHADRSAFKSKNSSGYWCGSVLGVRCMAHRVAWAIAHGEWPRGQIDHINGNRQDNRISNLRVVTAAENQKNQRIPKSNTSGVAGVCWDKSRGKWRAKITVNRKNIALGCFPSFDDAVFARRAAEVRFGFHANHCR